DHQYNGDEQRHADTADRCGNELRAIINDAQLGAGRRLTLDLRHQFAYAAHDIDRIRPRLALYGDDDRLAPIEAGDALVVLHAGPRLTNIRQMHGRAIAVTDDQIVVLRRPGQLSLGIDGVGAQCAVQRAGRYIGVRLLHGVHD